MLDLLNNDFFNMNAKTRELVADIKTLKACELELQESDYKIIKCYEYSLAGIELPYDIQELHEKREAIRERIRILQSKTEG
jgi:hypothetical protein